MFVKAEIEHSLSTKFAGKLTTVKFETGKPGHVDGEPFNFPEDYATGLLKAKNGKGYSEHKEESTTENTEIAQKLEQLKALGPDELRAAVSELCGRNFPPNTKVETLLKNAEDALRAE